MSVALPLSYWGSNYISREDNIIISVEMQEAMLWRKERNGVRCELCHAKCFISKGKFGICQVRKNENNKLFTLNYGKVLGLDEDWIEKKFLFHFLPRTKTLSVALPGCTLNENFCIDDLMLEKIEEEEYSPEDVVKEAERRKCSSISYSFTDPTISFEFVFKIAKAAHRVNIKNVFVTNGFITEEAIKKIAKYLDAASLRLKASCDPEFMKKYSLVPSIDPIIRSLKQMIKHRIFVEICNTIIPQIGDDLERFRRLAETINNEFSPEIPFHVLRFYPSKKFPGLPMTSASLIEKYVEEARRAGLRFVYASNLPESPDQNTYCYNCREVLITRKNSVVKKINLKDSRCPNCGLSINLVIE